MDVSRSGADEALFNAVITPHRSLTPTGLRWLFAGMAVVTGLVAFRFWLWGAWPVILFSVAEIALAALLLWINHRSARSVELVTLYQDHARIVRATPAGQRRETALPTAWMTVELDEQPQRVMRLFLCHRGRREEIGAALGEEQKRDLADALRCALAAQRNPRFDNPQLRVSAP
jgi:uncharacterized membrane protein